MYACRFDISIVRKILFYENLRCGSLYPFLPYVLVVFTELFRDKRRCVSRPMLDDCYMETRLNILFQMETFIIS